jgi:tetratricopeptide (TPR) repeat protein
MKAFELFRLIHSLDDREKRLYRREAGQNLRHGKSNYLLLFNAIASLENFDEELLLKKLKQEALIAQLPTHLSRLFVHILEFLRHIDAYPSIDVQLNAACERVTILYERGLYPSARKELKKAQKLAQENENYLQLMRMADLERVFFFSENSRSMMPFKEARKFRDQDFLQALHQQVELKLTHFEALFYAKTRTGDPQQVKVLLQKLGGRSLIKTIRDAQASATDLMLLDAIGLGAQLDGDFDKAYLAYSRMDSLWVSNPAKIAENATLYIGFISSFLHACLMKGRHDEFRNLLANLKTVRFGNELHSFMLKEALLYLELFFCLNRFDYDKGLALGPEIEAMLTKHKGRILGSRVITFYFNLGSLHFLKGEYSKANRWIAKLSMIHDQDFRQDVQAFVSFFQLILFIAMDDHDLVGTRLRALTRSSQRTAPNSVEAAILTLAQHFLRDQASDFHAALTQFHTELLGLINAGSKAIGVGECLFWAEGRLKGKLPGEVLREYAQGHLGES